MEVEPDVLREIEDKVLPFIKDIEDKYEDRFNEELIDDFAPKYSNALIMQVQYSYFIEKIKDANNTINDDNFLLERDKAQLTLFENLMLCEGLFDRMLGWLCQFGIWDNNTFQVRRGGLIEVRSAEDVMNTFTREKLDFLQTCNENFDIFGRYYNRKLRNAIAHCDYKILQSGNIILKHKSQDAFEMSYEDIQVLNNNLKDVCGAIHEAMVIHYDKYKDNANLLD